MTKRTASLLIWIALIVLLLIGLVAPPVPNSLPTGLASSGWLSGGLFSSGALSAGLFSVGVFSLGIFSFGTFAVGIWGAGQFVHTWLAIKD